MNKPTQKPTFIQTAGGSTPGKPHLNPPTHCDSCSNPIEQVFYDAYTPRGWGNFCPTCAELFQVCLGPGKGQKYTLQEIPDESPVPHPLSLGAALEAKTLYQDNYLIDLEAAQHQGDTEEEARLIDLLAALADGDHPQ